MQVSSYAMILLTIFSPHRNRPVKWKTAMESLKMFPSSVCNQLGLLALQSIAIFHL